MQQISIANIIPDPSFMQKLLIWSLDRLLGVKQMDRLYKKHHMQGLSKEAFSDRLIALLQLDLHGLQELQARIPKEGPLVIASNHPFGGIEGVILARAISQVRPDLKVLANKGLGIFSELSDYFIFTNPLSPNDVKNGPSLRQCMKHVSNHGALLIFPAGKVSYFQKQKAAISEHTWNKLIGRLIGINACQFLPVFISGHNSKWFYRAEKLYFKLRMLLLGRELLNKTGAQIHISTGYPVTDNSFSDTLSDTQKAAVCRAMSYAQDSDWQYAWPQDKQQDYKPLVRTIDPAQLQAEITQLPDEQQLYKHKQYAVYYGYQRQLPLVVQEIARLREMVFREHNEGSGEALDTDHFDATYTHLFIVDHVQSTIVGAYRMGLTDKLLAQDGIDGLYLHKMFDFKPSFVNQHTPCMEMGRSFLVPEMQGSFQGLLLLWRGIGRFVCKYPQYRTLYGTVSISKLYDSRSVKLIEAALVQNNTTQDVEPREPFDFNLHPEISDLAQELDLASQLKVFLRSIEADGKDIPVLAKQYLKMGAKFHALGIDSSFNHTPGLLLSVHLPDSPDALKKLYLGDGWQAYQDWQASSS